MNTSSGLTRSWDDITVQDYVKMQEIKNLQLATEDEKNLMVAAIINKVDYNDLIQMPLSSVKEYVNNTGFLLEKPHSNKARNKYTVNGREYRLIKNYEEMTVAQFIDFQAIQADGFAERPAELLAIFLVPKGHQYNDGYDKEQQIEDMLQLSIPDALGICNFFTKRLLKSLRLIQTALRLRMKWIRATAKKEDKEMMQAMELEMNLYLDQLKDMFGLIVPGL